MSPFYSHITSFNNSENVRDKIDQIILYVDNFFTPGKNDQYFIMDPYFNVDTALREPFKKNKFEETIWSNLITLLAFDGSAFFIMTNQDVSLGIPPTVIPFPESEEKRVEIQACYFPNGKIYNDYSLHDRYILKRGEDGIMGLHIGPSLTDIHNKDVTIISFNQPDALAALENFEFIWKECALNKGWKTN